MILYHGSYMNIETIDLSKSKPNKDFGRGFYLTADRQQALAMAKLKAGIMGTEPVVNAYELDDDLLTNGKYKVKRFDDYSKDWAEFVFRNRSRDESANSHDYDIVTGPIANDRVGVQIRRFMEKEITFDIFIERLKYMKGMTTQYFFGTKRAIDELHKINL